MYTSKTHGLIPNELASHHKSICNDLIKKAIEEAKTDKIDLVAYSRGPGMAPALYVGFNKAQELSKELDAPLIGVNHAVAHLTSGLLFNEYKDPVYLYLSGANTQVIALEGNKFRVFGETLDVGIGNALDKFGREAGLGFPAGPVIEELAKKGKYIELPYVVKGMDVSFTGIVTKCIELLKKGVKVEDLCYSLQETCFAMVTEVTERALAHTQKNEVLLIGGVAANKRLCNMLDIMCKERDAKFYAVPLKYAGDNGINIAWLGLLEYMAGRREKNSEIKPYERTDDVIVTWR